VPRSNLLSVTRSAELRAPDQNVPRPRLEDLRAPAPGQRPAAPSRPPAAEGRKAEAGPAAPIERQLLEMLLAGPDLVPLAAAEIGVTDIRHPGLRRLLEGLYQLQAVGQVPDLDRLRSALVDNQPLAAYALRMQE